jgi:hypothetical protein
MKVKFFFKEIETKNFEVVIEGKDIKDCRYKYDHSPYFIPKTQIKKIEYDTLEVNYEIVEK